MLGLMLALGMAFLHPGASGANTHLNVGFKTDLVNTGVDPNASGKVAGVLIRNGYASNQQLKLSLANLDPNTAYQLVAFIGDETTPRSVATFTSDPNGAFAVTYVQKCPGTALRGEPLPNAVDPISHIHQLDIVKAGAVVLTSLIGNDTQADCTAATVSFTVPVAGATAVAVNQAIAATFSEPMNPAT
ncbi:MAG TPA: Ig-like domain-containing protein, partial [Candidatus Saccharimonadales bacterium]|nr:Ig-like domain-containing protein [Candidatus Saccharimonadales bacterium]